MRRKCRGTSIQTRKCRKRTRSQKEETSEEKKEEAAVEAVEDDGIIDFTAETFNVKICKT